MSLRLQIQLPGPYLLVITVGTQPRPQLTWVCDIAQIQEANLHTWRYDTHSGEGVENGWQEIEA